MIDLHSHILPVIDDGAKDVTESLQLIRMELTEGVDTVALTPHFRADEQKIEEFVIRRQESLEVLQEALCPEKLQIKLILAAEVYLSPRLLKIEDKSPLCYAGTDFMLVEFPLSGYADWIPEVLYQLKLDGITPVIAHVERYPQIYKDTGILYSLVNAGAIAQANTGSILQDKRSRAFVFKCLKYNLIHVFGSDTHSVQRRPPAVRQPMAEIDRRFGSEYRYYLENNAKMILHNIIPPLYDPVKPAKGFTLFK